MNCKYGKCCDGFFTRLLEPLNDKLLSFYVRDWSFSFVAGAVGVTKRIHKGTYESL